MPDDSIWITMLRNPADMFESYYSFFEQRDKFGATLNEFLDSPHQYYRLDDNDHVQVRNPMLFDFGLNVQFMTNRTKIMEKIAEIDRIFDFVMIKEYFQESLILLSDLLCWNLEKFVTLQMNARPDSRKLPLNETIREKIEKWNWGDALFYHHFRAKFEEKLRKFGRGRIKNRVIKLQKITKMMEKFCEIRKIERTIDLDERIIPYKNNSIIFTLSKRMLKNKTCLHLTMNELAFTGEMREIHIKQMGRISPGPIIEIVPEW